MTTLAEDGEVPVPGEGPRADEVGDLRSGGPSARDLAQTGQTCPWASLGAVGIR